MTPPETMTIANELSQLRNDFGQFGRDVGEIKTACAVLVERSNRNEQDVRDLEADLDKRTTALTAQVDGLKRWVWTASGGAIVLGAVAGYAVQILA